jgi:AraC-like DNA-binding protein
MRSASNGLSTFRGDGQMDSHFETRLPAPILRRFISHYGGARVRGLTPGVNTTLPSRHAHLIISLDAPINVRQMSNEAPPAARFSALVSGLHDGFAMVERTCSWEGLHVFFRPLGLRAVLGATAAELACGAAALSDLCPRDAPELMERLSSTRDWQTRFAILDEVLTRRLTPAKGSPLVAHVWRQLAASHGRRSVESLAQDTGWSRQHMADRFRAELGITPKTAARIFRFERACGLISNLRQPLADVAAACGYADQAHMTRDWNAFTGTSPKAWIANELPFLQDYELSRHDDGVETSTPSLVVTGRIP